MLVSDFFGAGFPHFKFTQHPTFLGFKVFEKIIFPMVVTGFLPSFVQGDEQHGIDFQTGVAFEEVVVFLGFGRLDKLDLKDWVALPSA